MKVSALLLQYNLIDLLGLEKLEETRKSNIITDTTRVIIKNSIIKAHEQGYISKEDLDNLAQEEDSRRLQETVIQKVPQIKEIIELEALNIKKEALKHQVKDLLAFAKSKLENNSELTTKIENICTKMLSILDLEEISDEDRALFDTYINIRKTLKFNT